MKKTVLVSGGAGFIGSHVTVELIEAGYDVVVADNFSNCDLTCFEGVKKITGREDIPLVEMDFCDAEAVKKIFADYPIDAVIHFAAFKAVGESVAKPLMYYQNNLLSFMNVLQSEQPPELYERAPGRPGQGWLQRAILLFRHRVRRAGGRSRYGKDPA